MSSEQQVVIIKTGTTVPDLARRRGDFEDWIRAGMGVAPEALKVVCVFRGEPLPKASGWRKIRAWGRQRALEWR